MARAKKQEVVLRQDWTTLVPISLVISEEAMKYVEEKCREYGYVAGLAIILTADDEYELAGMVHELQAELDSSGYEGIGTMARPVPV